MAALLLTHSDGTGGGPAVWVRGSLELRSGTPELAVACANCRASAGAVQKLTGDKCEQSEEEKKV